MALKLVDSEGRAHSVLHPYLAQLVAPHSWVKGGLFPLIPYSNRIANARLKFGDDCFDLAPNPAVHPHTLHGNAHLQAWDIESTNAYAVSIVLDSPASEHWPWRFYARLTLELHSPSTLRIVVNLENTDSRPQPGGIGLHPYLAVAPSSEVQHDADHYWPMLDGLPGSLHRLPFNEGVAASPTLHLCSWKGRASAKLASGARLYLHATRSFQHLVIHRPVDDDYVCVEPTSHVVNGFNLDHAGADDTGFEILMPGESLSGELVMTLDNQSIL